MLTKLKSNLTWQGTTTKAPGLYSQKDIQNKTTSFQVNDINQQYNKFYIYDTPNINRHSFGRLTDQPFILRGIQRQNGDIERYKFGDVGTYAERVIEDATRIGKLLISPKGIIWNLTQFGLHASNPNVETNIGIRPTKVFSPISFASNLITAPIGIHKTRHMNRGLLGRYEDVQKQTIKEDVDKVHANRLERLRLELIGEERAYSPNQGSPTNLWGTIVQGVSSVIAPLQSLLAGFDGSEIKTLSAPGGPQSLYGIGYTTIRRATTTGAGLKDKLGNAYWGVHYNSENKYESTEQPGVPNIVNDPSIAGNSIVRTYIPISEKEFPNKADLPNRNAETGGHAVLAISDIFFNKNRYLENLSPVGGRYVGSENSVEVHIRPGIDPISRLLSDNGKSIIKGTPDTSTNTFEIGTKYLVNNSAAQNQASSREDTNPGGGRYVGTSPDASEETLTRPTNADNKNLIEYAHRYHVYQKRDDAYPAGYYNLINSNGGPRSHPTGKSKHNIYQSLEAEAELVRSLVNGKTLISHVHSFLFGPSSKTSTAADLNTFNKGYIKTQLNSTPTDASDWDTNDRRNFYQLKDPAGQQISSNTPQLRKSADDVFKLGSPTNYKNYIKISPSTTSVMTLGAMKAGDKIFNYFTPDLKFFSGVTSLQLDEGDAGHKYTSLASVYKLGADINPPAWQSHGLDSQQVPMYNDVSFAPKFTPTNPKTGPSPSVGQIVITNQESQQLKEIDKLIVEKLDPLKNGKTPDESSVRTIGGKPKATSENAPIYNYMGYSVLRKQESSVGNTKRINEFRQTVADTIATEIQSRNLNKLGYGGAGQPDSLNKLAPGAKPGEEDIVPFYIAHLGGGQALYFRAGINSISDSFTPSWTEIKEIGRADAKVLLEGWARSFSLDLTLAAGSEAELLPMWEKLNTLASWTAPDYSKGNGYSGTFVELTLGDLYKQVPCYLSSLAVNIDNETPWEITAGRRSPKYAKVTMDLAYIGASMPSKGSSFFGISP